MYKSVVFLIVSTACIALAMPRDAFEEKTYPRFIQLPDGEGNMHQVDLEAEPDYNLLQQLERSSGNTYFLHTRRNRLISQSLVLNDASSITRSNYNRNVPTIVVAHGWLSSRHTNPNPQIRDAYLAKSDVNVIIVDWSSVARSAYATAVRGVPNVGRDLGQFIRFLVATAGGDLRNFHIIGFSLGAHVVGNAGRELGGRVARVTGLDPAGPLWNINRNRLSPGDGVYVEAIHTNGGTNGLGIGSAVADADFFPNGGVSQPGCPSVSNICDHERAWQFFVATVTHNNLIGNGCSNTLQISSNTCRGRQLHMGNDDLRKTGNGLFRVNTGSRYPWNL